GDLNGDGKLDVVAVNSGDGTVSILLNTTAPGASAATFATQQVVATGNQPSAVAMADMNGDGKLDLVVANSGDNTLSVLMNTTTGASTLSFATHVDFGAGLKPSGVALGDLNGDGRPDVAVANSADGSVSVL